MSSLESFCNLERIERIKKKSNNKDFMINLLEDGDIQKIDGLIEFALSDNIINLATKYLNTIPFLAYIYIFHSLPNDTVQSSQLFIVILKTIVNLNFLFK